MCFKCRFDIRLLIFELTNPSPFCVHTMYDSNRKYVLKLSIREWKEKYNHKFICWWMSFGSVDVHFSRYPCLIAYYSWNYVCKISIRNACKKYEIFVRKRVRVIKIGNSYNNRRRRRRRQRQRQRQSWNSRRCWWRWQWQRHQGNVEERICMFQLVQHFACLACSHHTHFRCHSYWRRIREKWIFFVAKKYSNCVRVGKISVLLLLLFGVVIAERGESSLLEFNKEIAWNEIHLDAWKKPELA